MWYVDKESLQDYLRLGLDAVVGGKLTPARNMALEDAHRRRQACVQLSDDIHAWAFQPSKKICADIFEGNKVAKSAKELRCSPVAAARFLLAKMRATPGKERPRLGGVFPLPNKSMAFSHKLFSSDGFILGDFFVHDLSPCRFDTRMTLKEDYDFTCQHLATHGSVLRVNRMFLHVTHETNAGGACDTRDAAGERERENVRLLMSKWPGVFHINGNRKGGDIQVVMSWRRRRASAAGGS